MKPIPEFVKRFEPHTVDGAPVTYGQPVEWVTDVLASGTKVAHWSHPTDPPPLLGSIIKSREFYRGAYRSFGEGVVQEYRVEYGFLYAVTSFPKMPKKYRTKGTHPHEDLIYVAGIDLMPNGGRTPRPKKKECKGHPAGPNDPMGQTVYCDGTCA